MKTRETYQRDLVFDAVASLDHPNALEVYTYLKTKDFKIGRATVFRNLNTLSNMNKILKINIPGEGCRYDKTLTTHSHFICDCCHQIYDISQPQVIYSEDDHKILGYDLVFRGVCQKCLKK